MRLPLVLAVCMAAVACDKCGPKVKAPPACEGVNGVQVDFTDACESSSQCGDHFNCQKPARDSAVTCCMRRFPQVPRCPMSHVLPDRRPHQTERVSGEFVLVRIEPINISSCSNI